MGDLVRLEREGRVGLVTLNRPEKLNAVNAEVIQDLREVWAEVKRDDAIRVAILRGEGRAFCVGADLSGRSPEERAMTADHGVSEDRQGILEGFLAAGMDAWTLPKPVISQVHGYCIAGGTILATLTDLIYVAEDTVIGWPKVPVGGGLISPIWSWMIGPYRAKEFSFDVGSTFTGSEAVGMGWGNRAVPLQNLESETWKMAERVAKVSSDLLGVKKAAINHQMDAKGFSSAIKFGAEMDSIAHTTTAVEVTRQKLGELGIRGAIEWWERGQGID